MNFEKRLKKMRLEAALKSPFTTVALNKRRGTVTVNGREAYTPSQLRSFVKKKLATKVQEYLDENGDTIEVYRLKGRGLFY